MMLGAILLVPERKVLMKLCAGSQQCFGIPLVWHESFDETPLTCESVLWLGAVHAADDSMGWICELLEPDLRGFASMKYEVSCQFLQRNRQ